MGWPKENTDVVPHFMTSNELPKQKKERPFGSLVHSYLCHWHSNRIPIKIETSVCFINSHILILMTYSDFFHRIVLISKYKPPYILWSITTVFIFIIKKKTTKLLIPTILGDV